MSTTRQLVETYLQGWNETDRLRRRALIEEVYAEHAAYTDPMIEARGWEAIDATISAVQNGPQPPPFPATREDVPHEPLRDQRPHPPVLPRPGKRPAHPPDRRMMSTSPAHHGMGAHWHHHVMNAQTTDISRPVGDLLREWRRHRRLSQLDLATGAEISTRHLSFVESGRSQPSRDMILHLAEYLDLPLRERNALLGAAGFAPAFKERPLDDPALASARHTIDLLLKGLEPYPHSPSIATGNSSPATRPRCACWAACCPNCCNRRSTYCA